MYGSGSHTLACFNSCRAESILGKSKMNLRAINSQHWYGKSVWNQSLKTTMAPSQYQDGLAMCGIPIIKKRRSRDRVLFLLWILMRVRRYIYLEKATDSVYPTWSNYICWEHKELKYNQPWYWQSCHGVFWFLQKKVYVHYLLRNF